MLPLLPFKQFQPSKLLDTCVIVPVKNEADHLRITLQSLLEQADEQGNKICFSTYEVLVLINNSDDGSYQIARDFQTAHPSFCLHVASVDLPQELANIGTARKMLMDEAYRRFQCIGNTHGIIASIDGDTSADLHWLCQIRQEIRKGNDAVGGRILTREDAGLAEEAYEQDLIYRCLLTQVEELLCPQANDPLPRHFQFFGANMAVTAEYYDKAGGIPNVECLEDVAFHRALIRCDARIRRSYNVKVTTSARFEGRVATGFSEQLKKWSDDSLENKPQLVHASEDFIYACFLKGQFKTHWENRNTPAGPGQIEPLAKALGLCPLWLKSQLYSYTFFGACWEDTWEAGTLRHDMADNFEPIRNAIQNLKRFIQDHDVTAFQTDPAGIYLRAG